jgi:acyl phosphate:glycerol-3-phosphate acyltransferase
MNAPLVLVLTLVGSYILGSINFTVIIFRLIRLDDPRKKFSGNPGTTNVYRIAGPFWAGLVLVLDIGRAGLVSIASLKLLPVQAVALAGFFLVLGNRFPCFHGFKGGKGVASYMGFVIFIIPAWGLLATFLWPLIYKLIKVTFMPSFIVITMMGIGLSFYFLFNPISTTATAATVLLIFAGHKKNIMEFLSLKKTT